MTFVFLQAPFLWLLAVVPLLWFLPRRVTNWRHAIVRTLVVGLLVLALARPALLRPEDGVHQVVIWDRSESIPAASAPEVESTVREWFGGLPKNARPGILVLNGARNDAPPRFGEIAAELVPGSSISQALGAAARRIPVGARGSVTLVSDGLATDRQWGEAVRPLAERGIPVHTISVAPRGDDVYPAGVRAWPPVRVGQTARIDVDVVGDAEQIEVSLLSGGKVLVTSGPSACRGRVAVNLEFEPGTAGILELEARVRVLAGNDTVPENNAFSTSLAVQEPMRALYLGQRLTGSRDKVSGLLGKGIELTEPSVAQLSGLVASPEELGAYDLVVIDDRPAESVPRPLQAAIVEQVKERGLGLFYSGGKGVFGTGGYFDTPVASILPVEMIQREEKRDPSTTLVVIIDTSGSMGGERVQLAKECARLAIRRLLPHDKVGIVEFYGTKQWAAPIQTAANAIDIQRAINRLDAGGGTVILPAIEEAFYALQNVRTRYKHVLVLTDGGVEAGDFESIMRRMAGRGINVSTVLVGGSAHSEFLVNMANWGKGHFYAASNRFSIPEILLKQPSTSKIPPYRPGIYPVRLGGSSGWWGDIDRPADPQLAGYVETRLRPGAQAIVETEVERHPVVASWRYGLGRVTAMMTEPAGAGTQPWNDWSGYGSWLLRVLTRTSREHPQPFVYTIERSLIDARVIARRLVAEPFRPMAVRVGDTGEPEELVFRQRAADVFTARLLAKPEDTVHLQASAEGWTGRAAHVVSPPPDAAVPELNVDPRRALDLERLAADTGGRHVSLGEAAGFNPVPGGGSTAVELVRLWPWCLLVALGCYLGDLLYRRWPNQARRAVPSSF